MGAGLGRGYNISDLQETKVGGGMVSTVFVLAFGATWFRYQQISFDNVCHI